MTMLAPTVDQLEAATMRRVAWRLMPFLLAAYVICYIDRVNVGFAALQMNKDLGLTPAVFGFGASLFFVSYFLVEVPSNLALQKVGARRWIARIMITWGIITACMAFVVGPYSFYALRFILGAAEAGFSRAPFSSSPIGSRPAIGPVSWRRSLSQFRWRRSSARRFRCRCWNWMAPSASRVGSGCSS